MCQTHVPDCAVESSHLENLIFLFAHLPLQAFREKAQHHHIYQGTHQAERQVLSSRLFRAMFSLFKFNAFSDELQMPDNLYQNDTIPIRSDIRP